MGRTLDTLRHSEAHRTARAAVAPPAGTPPEECVVDWTLQEEVPFIEVGAPGKSVEVSPLLVKHPPQAKVQPPHPPLAKGVAKAPAVVNLTETKPMAVAFEAWPGPAIAPGIAVEVIAHHQPEHPVSKEYASLLDKILQTHTGPGPHVLMLCGIRPRVGASTVLLNLAVIAARRRRRVAVADINRARPSLATRLGHVGSASVQDVIAGSLAIGQAVAATVIPALHLLPCGGPVKASDPLCAEAVSWLTAWLRERFDVILIDGPCVEETADLAVLTASTDGIYLVLPQGEGVAATRCVAQTIARMGGRLRGLIHTHFEV
jgi:Mrp family chromosome partitioning ATPase